jgi:thioredoxin-related protein
MKALCSLLLVGSFLAPIAAVADEATGAAPYLVATYDPKRDPEGDVSAAVNNAKGSGKRILLQVGGDWCSWCHLMSKYFHENEKVAKALTKDYVIVKVNYSEENQNKEFLSKYPKVKGYPHLFVLDSDGKLLHSQGTSELEEGQWYNEEKVLSFLSKWAGK